MKQDIMYEQRIAEVFCPSKNPNTTITTNPTVNSAKFIDETRISSFFFPLTLMFKLLFSIDKSAQQDYFEPGLSWQLFHLIPSH